MKVLLLGGAGAMCTPTTRDIVEVGEFSKVTVADIDVDKAKELASSVGLEMSSVVKVDANDEDSLVELMDGYDVVVVGLPAKFATNVLKAAIKVGANVLDLGCDDPEIFTFQEEAKRAGIAHVIGCGATPGVTNMMAKHGADRMDQVEEINISFAALRSFALSPALVHTILWEFDPDLEYRAYYKEGQFYPVPPFSGEKTIEFPDPIGARKVYFVPHGETRTLSKNIEGIKTVQVRGTFTPKAMSLLKSLLEYDFYSQEPIKIEGKSISPRELISQTLLQMPEATEKEELWGYGLHVEVMGIKQGTKVKRTYWTTHPGMDKWGVPWAYSNNVGLPLSVGAHLLGKGEHELGVNAPEGIFEPEIFFKELRERGIRVHSKEEWIS